MDDFFLRQCSSVAGGASRAAAEALLFGVNGGRYAGICGVGKIEIRYVSIQKYVFNKKKSHFV